MGPPEPQPFANLESLLGNAQWPVMPEVSQALIRTLHGDDADMFGDCQIIKKDPALTANLLRMANFD